jgi:hypothetical protein
MYQTAKHRLYTSAVVRYLKTSKHIASELHACEPRLPERHHSRGGRTVRVLDSLAKALNLDRTVAEGVLHALVDAQREDELTTRLDTIEVTLDECLGTVGRASDCFTFLHVPPID